MKITKTIDLTVQDVEAILIKHFIDKGILTFDDNPNVYPIVTEGDFKGCIITVEVE